MAEKADELTIAQRLGQALDRGQLPAGGPAEAAERLIERLDRPARVALLGLPGAGKSAVLNLLAGETVINEALRLPTVLVQRGGEEQMVCTLPDGTVNTLAGRDLAEVVPLAPAMVTMELQLPALSVISLLEVSAGPAEPDQRRAATWASKRADIVVWCSTSFLPKEQMVWESLPDVIKDNGFLFLTKTDLMGGKDAVSGMVERVELRAGEEFRQILPLSVANARKAMQAPGGIDRVMFRESGASAVITAIKSRVEMARRVDTDMAELLLARHAVEPEPVASWSEPVEVPPPAAQPEVAPEPPAVVEMSAEVQAPEPVAEPVSEPEATTPQEPEPVPEPEPGDQPVVDAEVEAEPVAAPDPEAEPELPETEREPVEPEPVAEEPPLPDPEPEVEEPQRRRFADRLKQAPPAYNPPVYEPPTVPRQTLGRQPILPVERPVMARRVPLAQPADPDVTDTAPEGKVVPPPLAKPVPRSDSLRDIFARTEEEIVEAEQALEAPPTTELEEADEHEVEAEAEPVVEPATLADAPPDPAPPRERVASRLSQAVRAQPDLAPEPAPQQVRVASRVSRAVPVADEPDAAGRPSRRERPRIAPRVMPAPSAGAPAASVVGADRELLEAAVKLIMQRAGELAETLEGVEKVPVDIVLEHGRETAEKVGELLSKSQTGEVRRIGADLGEVQDLIMLMQLEKGHAPADDTLTLLLQIRRDLETLLAA